MKRRVLLFSVIGNRMIGRHLRYLAFVFNVVVPMKERVLLILFRVLFRFDEFVRETSVFDVVVQFVVGVIEDAVRMGVGGT